MKTNSPIHFGPHGTFVREVLLNPVPPAHDYLGNPEIVEDIARCYGCAFGTHLESRYSEAATPCIVTFTFASSRAAQNSVFWLAYDMLRDGMAGFNANGASRSMARLYHQKASSLSSFVRLCREQGVTGSRTDKAHPRTCRGRSIR